MRKQNIASLFVAGDFFLACSIFFFGAVTLLSCSGAAGHNGGTTPDSAGSSSAAGDLSGSGDDMYYEYTTTTVGSKLNMNGFTKLYVSSGGGVRSEMQMGAQSGKNDRSGLIVLIASKDKPNQSITIDDSAKTYTVNFIDTAAPGGAGAFKMVSGVTNIGTEKIMGYNGVHARVISTRSMGPLGKMTDTIDLWNSPEVPLAPFFRKYWDRNNSRTWTALMTPAATDQLKQMGCTGFMLKMESGSKEANVRMELTKIQKGDFPKSMFEIPAGYKEVKD